MITFTDKLAGLTMLSPLLLPVTAVPHADNRFVWQAASVSQVNALNAG